MKEFDLKLALAGHPLVTRDGKEIVYFTRRGNGSCDDSHYGFIGLTKDRFSAGLYTKHGKYNPHRESDLDLMLADVDFKPEIKMGETIQIFLGGKYVDRLFLKYHADGGVIYVDPNFEEVFRKGLAFNTMEHHDWRVKDKDSDLVCEIKFTQDGFPVEPKYLTDEEILKIVRTGGL